MKKKISQKKQKIGIIGLGNAGGVFAEKFIRKGYPLYVYDLNKNAIKKFTDQGARACTSPKEVAQKADVIFEITPNDQSSRKVWLDDDGILNGATPSKILIASATLSAKWIDELANRCNKAGFQFFDMGINGGDRGITLLCGGDKDVLKEITPILRAVAAKIWYFGPAGQGMRYKLILNYLQAMHIIGFHQAIKIAKEQHMNVKKVGKALVTRPGGVLTELAWDTYLDTSDDVFFKIELITKDLRYVKELTENMDGALIDAVLAEYQHAIEKGHGKKDWLSIVKMEV